ncbi:Beta-glucanase, partial [Globisporangium splendens]
MKIAATTLFICLGLLQRYQQSLHAAAQDAGLDSSPSPSLEASGNAAGSASSSAGSVPPIPLPAPPVSMDPPALNSSAPIDSDSGSSDNNYSNATYGSPQPLEPPASLLEHTDAASRLCPPKYLDPSVINNRAIPTNNWWGNIIAHDSGSKIQPVWPNPYALQVIADLAPFGLAVSYPYRSRVSGGSSGNSGANRYYAHGILREFMLSSSEFASTKPEFRVLDWADQGVTVQLKSGAGKLESDLVSGMVYTTAKYTSLSPKLISTAAISSVNGKAARSGDVFRGSKFEISCNNGQTWVVYALSSDGVSDKETSFTVDGRSSLNASGSFDGILRAALAVENSWVPTLDTYRSCIVQGASVSIESDAAYSFNWKTMGNCASGLLHYAMAHHVDSMDASGSGPQKVVGMVTHSTTRGSFQAYATRPSSALVWKFSETQQVPSDFYPARKVSSSVVQSQRILEHLRTDIVNTDWSIPTGGSYYFNGKTAQKYASLCLMANDAAIVGQDKSLLNQCLAKLRTIMLPFVNNGWTNKLQYDRVYRGIVSSEGYKKNDLNADFGNTMYNDHHFHYGYWIHTAAMINLLDPSWSELNKLNTMANLLVRDVANFDDRDKYFPRFRSFDWFRGHSYSHGVTPLADGKDQESSSEDVNFSFGMYMFGKATNQRDMMTVGKLMTRLNAHAIKTYFLMEDQNQIHPPNFLPNKVTGIFFDNKVDYATWFSAEKYCIHGIQMIPVSAVTEFVRTKQFVRQEWDQVLSREEIVTSQDTDNAWLSLLYLNYAAVNKDRAMGVLQNAKMDDGLTRSWALYMAASFSD